LPEYVKRYKEIFIGNYEIFSFFVKPTCGKKTINNQKKRSSYINSLELQSDSNYNIQKNIEFIGIMC